MPIPELLTESQLAYFSVKESTKSARMYNPEIQAAIKRTHEQAEQQTKQMPVDEHE